MWYIWGNFLYYRTEQNSRWVLTILCNPIVFLVFSHFLHFASGAGIPGGGTHQNRERTLLLVQISKLFRPACISPFSSSISLKKRSRFPSAFAFFINSPFITLDRPIFWIKRLAKRLVGKEERLCPFAHFNRLIECWNVNARSSELFKILPTLNFCRGERGTYHS